MTKRSIVRKQRTFSSWYCNGISLQDHVHCTGDGVEITSLGILFATDLSVQRSIIHSKSKFAESSVNMEVLGKIKYKIEMWCAGFLELFPIRTIDEAEDLTQHKIFAKRKVENFEVQFIHRTAHDYLLDTAEGQDLLNSCDYTEEELNISIIKAMLCYALLFTWPKPRRFDENGVVSSTWTFETDITLEAVLGLIEAHTNWCSAHATDKIIELLSLLKESTRVDP